MEVFGWFVWFECLEGGLCVKRFKNVVTDLEARCKRLGFTATREGSQSKRGKVKQRWIMIMIGARQDIC